MDSNWNRRSLLQVHLAYNRQDVISNKFSNHIIIHGAEDDDINKQIRGESMSHML